MFAQGKKLKDIAMGKPRSKDLKKDQPTKQTKTISETLIFRPAPYVQACNMHVLFVS